MPFPTSLLCYILLDGEDGGSYCQENIGTRSLVGSSSKANPKRNLPRGIKVFQCLLRLRYLN